MLEFINRVLLMYLEKEVIKYTPQVQAYIVDQLDVITTMLLKQISDYLCEKDKKQLPRGQDNE